MHVPNPPPHVGGYIPRNPFLFFSLSPFRVFTIAAFTGFLVLLADPAMAATNEARFAAPGPAPEGMVWIPGGEFSMGSDVAGDALCSQPGVTRDAQPIHRVYVDGFWMDKTKSPMSSTTNL
jgi:formylglycine-generating enzyme required for sulfatase activity